MANVARARPAGPGETRTYVRLHLPFLHRRSRRILFSIALLAGFLFTISDTCLHASNHFVNAASTNGAAARSEEQDRWVAVALRAIVQLVVSASIAAGTKNWPWGPVRAWPRLLVMVSRSHCLIDPVLFFKLPHSINNRMPEL